MYWSPHPSSSFPDRWLCWLVDSEHPKEFHQTCYFFLSQGMSPPTHPVISTRNSDIFIVFPFLPISHMQSLTKSCSFCLINITDIDLFSTHHCHLEVPLPPSHIKFNPIHAGFAKALLKDNSDHPASKPLCSPLLLCT